jgi:predicted lipoprotein with Yx(FWY)xxD motif
MVKRAKSVFSLLCPLSTLASLSCVFSLCETLAQDKFPIGTYVGGSFTMTFNSDGSHSVSANEKVVVKRTYTVTQDQIVFTDKEGEYACKGAETGRYNWKYDGKALTFSKLEDDCEGRINGLTGQAWEKKQK